MFLFTHIEKCAGTSFNGILSLTYLRYIHVTRNNYGGNELRNDLSAEQLQYILRFHPSGIGGHSVRPYLNFNNQTFEKAKKITFLRNPLERYVSQFNHDYERGFTESFEHFLNRDYCKDFMTTKLAGTIDYNFAKKKLNDFDFVGDANRFNQSVNCLQDVLNKNFFGKYIHENKRSSNKNYLKLSDLSSRELLRVEENNRNDIKLYEDFIVKKNELTGYSEKIKLKKPSEFRAKLVRKINKFKKEKIVNPIREENKK